MKNRVAWRLGVLLTLGLLLACIPGAGRVRAQAGAPSRLVMTYRDDQGAGQVSLTAQGSDASGGTAVAVSLTQNGMTYAGQGDEWRGTADTPRSPIILAFWLTDGAGHDFFFSGMLQFGVDTIGGTGQWTLLQDPSLTGNWSMNCIVPRCS